MIMENNLINILRKFVKKILPNLFVNKIKMYLQKKKENKELKIIIKIKSKFKNTTYINYDNVLSKLCEKYGSDKGFINPDQKKPYNWTPHSYTSYYYSIFNLSKDKIKLIFECGLGTNNPSLASNMTATGIPGASLRVWRDYFKNAEIYGGDIDKEILFEEERIKTFYVDQLNKESINSMWKNINLNNCDIIIDDGLHTPAANLNFFFNSFNKLKNNGIYIIEDVKNKHLEYIKEKLKDYDVEIVTLSNKFMDVYGSNLIIVRKT